MRKIKDTIKKGIVKYAHILAAVAFVFVTVSANSSCVCPFYEPEQPKGLAAFKKVN